MKFYVTTVYEIIDEDGDLTNSYMESVPEEVEETDVDCIDPHKYMPATWPEADECFEFAGISIYATPDTTQPPIRAIFYNEEEGFFFFTELDGIAHKES